MYEDVLLPKNYYFCLLAYPYLIKLTSHLIRRYCYFKSFMFSVHSFSCMIMAPSALTSHPGQHTYQLSSTADLACHEFALIKVLHHIHTCKFIIFTLNNIFLHTAVARQARWLSREAKNFPGGRLTHMHTQT